MIASDTIKNYQKELFLLIHQHAGLSVFLLQDDLEHDMGISGDDAYEFLEIYSKRFKVDLSGFNFNSYFYDEGSLTIYLLFEVFKRYNKKRLTAHDLLKGIELGKLV